MSTAGLVTSGGTGSGSYNIAFMSSSGRNYSNPIMSSGVPSYDPSRSAYAEQREKPRQRAAIQSDTNDAINRHIISEFDDRSYFPKGDYEFKISAGEMRENIPAKMCDEEDSPIIEKDENENGNEEGEEEQDGLDGVEGEEVEDYIESERERNERVERGEETKRYQ